MIIVSVQMFEKIIARAQVVGEETWRRLLFSAPGLRENASPEALEFIKQRVVNHATESYVERLARSSRNERVPS